MRLHGDAGRPCCWTAPHASYPHIFDDAKCLDDRNRDAGTCQQISRRETSSSEAVGEQLEQAPIALRSMTRMTGFTLPGARLTPRECSPNKARRVPAPGSPLAI